jgi:hypothetical protein
MSPIWKNPISNFEMKNYRFILEKKGSKHICPSCGKRREFTRYEDTRTGELLPDQYGICNRLDRCGYNLNPYKDGYSQKVWEQEQGEQLDSWKFQTLPPKVKPKHQAPASFIRNEVFKGSLNSYNSNCFARFLIRLFGEDIASELIGRYFLGSTAHRFKNREFPDYLSEVGANIFWQIDINGQVRSGKVMLYDPLTGKRVKKLFNHVTWVHKTLRLEGFELRQCLFGEHLLAGDSISPVAIVESEKTAIIASVYFPQFLWLACGAMQNLNAERCGVLKGRHVILFPDLNAFEKWSVRSKELTQQLPGILFTISNLLEKNASEVERSEGLDLADYLIRFNWKQFQESEKSENNAAPNKTFSGQKSETVNIQVANIARIISETKIEVLKIVCIQTNNGQYYDLLYNDSGEPVQPGVIIPDTLWIEFYRDFQPGTLDGEPCLVSKPLPQKSEKGEKSVALIKPCLKAENLIKPNIPSLRSNNWDADLTGLEAFFKTAFIPTEPIKLDKCGTITDPAKFIDSHLNSLRANNGNRAFAPFLKRLLEFKTIINKTK